MNRTHLVSGWLATAASVVVLALAPVRAGAATVTINTPSLDRWMYPFNSTPGSRTTASTFGAIGEEGFDDRDAQFLIGFNTAAAVPVGLGAGAYDVSSVTVTATVSLGGAFVYDGTEDSLASYTPGGTDGDAGRPVDLFGVGYRNGFTRETFAENSPFSPPGGPAERVRNTFAADYDGATAVDVSNNVTGTPPVPGFDANPWATGTATLTPGDTVPANSTFSFNLDLSDPDVLAYVREGLNAGDLRFILSSLHEATLGGSATYPLFYTKENTGAAAVPVSLSVTLVPEPSSLAIVGIIGGALALARRRRP